MEIGFREEMICFFSNSPLTPLLPREGKSRGTRLGVSWINGCAFLLAFLISCQPTSQIERPKDPWVLRSVLDSRTRMVTIALHSDLFVAYDLSKCGLYKIWTGGISQEGAAYTNQKNVQPTSWGESYYTNELDKDFWFLASKGDRFVLQPKFKGYSFKDEHVFLKYELLLAGQSIARIEERPEFVGNESGEVGLERIFNTSSDLENTVIQLNTQNQMLNLNLNDETQLQTFFDPLPKRSPPTQEISHDHLGRLWLERSGCNTCHEVDQKTIGPSYSQIAARYESSKENIELLGARVKEGSKGVWGNVLMMAHPHLIERELRMMVHYILSLDPDPEPSETPLQQPEQILDFKPGFGAPLEGVHPGFDLETIRPHWFKPRVGGMDFLPDGRLLVSTWDSLGAVYVLRGVQKADTNKITINRIAEGLHEPLGLKVVEEDIFVIQKPEITQLIDHNGDDIIDEYRSICNGYDVSTDFHEFAYGLEHKDGYLYANLGVAMRLMSDEVQLPDRGTTIKVGMDGKFEKILTGLRQANGIGKGPDNELFISENQGQWVPACKIVAVKEGEFHGCQYGTGDRFKGYNAALPAVWLPQDEIGNSPGQPVVVPDGLYEDQLLVGEVTHGGVKRVFLEKVNGEWQGAVFRFTQGLEAGVNRLVWGPEGALYVGGVGMTGNWGWKFKQYGLQKLKPNGKTAFEMLAVSAQSNGIEIEFTEPLGEGYGTRAEDYFIQQWWYKITSNYGGPKKDFETLEIKSIVVSEDRKRVKLQIPGIKKERVIYIRLNDELQSTKGKSLWSSEAWYTMNHIPN